MRDARLREMVEQVQQLLACGFACFLPGCADAELRHPLLDFAADSPIVYSPSGVAQCFLETVSNHEHIQALYDLALLSGRVHTLPSDSVRPGQRCLSSLALVSVERPAGVLGVLLLADEHAGKFGPGETQLLAAALDHYARLVEHVYYEQARRWVQACREHMEDHKEQAEISHAFTKNEIVSLVGHELRTPLSVIKGYAGLLQMYGDASQEQPMAPERQRQYLDAILEQTRFLEVLVNDLLDISRLQHGKLALRPTTVDVGILCRQIAQLGQLRADQQEPGKYQLICQLDQNLPPLQADADRLRQVLLNVVENAIKYSPQGGRIELAAHCPEPRVGQSTPPQIWVSIRDQGMGIPSQHIARLLQPFERLERPATSHISGSGLGLYIARSLVEAMGGTLAIHSCEGSGTDVTIVLETVIQTTSLLT